MTDPVESPPFRHPAVYRTVRGGALSAGRALPASGRREGDPAHATPLRVSEVMRVRPAGELAAPDASEPDDAADICDADGLFAAAGSLDPRRYREPND